MTTCSEVIDRALLKLGVRSAGSSANAGQAESALYTLQGMLTGWVNGGAFGRARDVYVTSDYTAQEGDRVHADNTETLTVTIPDTYLYGPLEVAPLSADGLSTAYRQPRDCSFVIVNDGQSVVTYIYDGYFGAWTAIEALTLASTAPFATRDKDGLASTLALELSSDYPGVKLDPATIASARKFKSLLTSRMGSPSSPVVHTFF